MNAWIDAPTAAVRSMLGQRCLLCEAGAEQPVCADCERQLPVLAPQCPCCALPSPGQTPCGACLAHAPAFDATVALWPYAFPVDRLIIAFKFHARLQLAPWFAAALAPRVAGVDRLIALPLHRTRLAERGFNQAHEIARRLASFTGIPLVERGALRERPTGEQASLPHDERAKNVRGAFACPGRWEPLCIGVVDDVMTTGATLQEFAAALKRAGAARVVNLVLARTLPQ